jgi:predicted HTH transcriptional regulator
VEEEFSAEASDLHTLRKLIAQGESQMLDYKQRITNSYKIAKALSAFANTRGGTLLIGVRDDKTILGIDPDEELYLLEQSAQLLQPVVSYSYSVVEDEELRQVLVVEIEESEHKPHKLVQKNGQEVFYVRLNDKSVQGSKNTLRALEAAESERTAPKAAPQIPTGLVKAERLLASYFQNKERITVKQYARLRNISERRARRTLYELAAKGYLLLHEFEREDFYSLLRL